MTQRTFNEKDLLDCPRCGESKGIADKCVNCGLERNRAVTKKGVPLAEMTPEAVDALPWRKVTSSQIEAIARDDEHLYVRFPGGTAYRYSGTTRMRELGKAIEGQDWELTCSDLHDVLVEAEEDEKASVGKTFNLLVKNSGVYYARITIREAEAPEEGVQDGG